MAISTLLQRQTVLLAVLLVIICLSTSSNAQAQLTRGFDRTSNTLVPSVELVRQPDLWLMEVQLKPMRLVHVTLPDPQTGELRKELVWYLTWRSIVRPLENRSSDDTLPVNQLDPLPGPRMFIPEFTLVTYDDPQKEIPAQILQDEILPAAMADIRKIERLPLKNSVDVIQPVPEPTPADAESQNWIYGAATWRGVDPETDFFKVILGGFSNGYELKEVVAGEKPQAWRKVLVQRFYRPGDRFDPTLREFQFSGGPMWIFQPDPTADSAAGPAAAAGSQQASE